MPKPRLAPPLPNHVAPKRPDQLPNLTDTVGALAKLKGRNLVQISKALGYHSRTLYSKLQRKDIYVSELMALSEAVGHNLFDMYIIRLPNHLQATSHSIELELQLEAKDLELAQLRKELDDAKRERDVFLDLLKSGR